MNLKRLQYHLQRQGCQEVILAIISPLQSASEHVLILFLADTETSMAIHNNKIKDTPCKQTR